MAKDLRTPLGKALGLGSAKSGTEHFIAQRFTAIANVPLFIGFVFLIIILVGDDYASVHRVMANPIVAVLIALMIISGIYHMKIGMQVIVEDYFPQHLLRVVLLTLNAFFSFLLGGICIVAVLKITLGG